jgi:hypothetical protein
MYAEQTAVLSQRLSAAEKALHDLVMGQQAQVFIDQNGERVEFTPTTVPRLRAYVRELSTALGKVPLSGAVPTSLTFTTSKGT